MITCFSIPFALHTLFSLHLINVAISSSNSLKHFRRIPFQGNHRIQNNYLHSLHSQISDVGRGGDSGHNNTRNSYVTEFTISPNDQDFDDEIISNGNDITSYITIGRISLYSDVRKDNKDEEYLPNIIPNFRETNNVQARSFQDKKERLRVLISPIINYIMENDHEISKDLICAYYMNKGVSSVKVTEPTLVKGALGYFESSTNTDILKKGISAECMGCVSDLIILALPPFATDDSESTTNRRFSNSEIQIILNRLIKGIKRKIQSKSELLSSMQKTPTITTLWIHSLTEDKKNARTMEDNVYDKIVQELHKSNMDNIESIIQINRSSHIFGNATNVKQSTKHHLLRHIPNLKNEEERENDVPFILLPTLIQNICYSFLLSEDKNSSEKHAKQLISFKQKLALKLSKGNDSNDSIARVKSSSNLKSEFISRLHQVTMSVRRRGESALSSLEAKQDEATLRGGMPILEFGKDASNILQIINKEFDTVMESILKSANKEFIKECKQIVQERRMEVLLNISYGAITKESTSSSSLKGSITNLQILYNNQLSALREYYGRKFEEFLDDNEIEGENNISNNVAAQQCTEGFKTAAIHGIPKLCQYDQKLHYEKIKNYNNIDSDSDIVAFDFLPALEGLLKDMMASLESRNIMEEDWASVVDNSDENTDDGNYPEKKQRTWYEKLAARLLIMGVNYGQGWLALQVIKKAATERDRNMPKFPLF